MRFVLGPIPPSRLFMSMMPFVLLSLFPAACLASFKIQHAWLVAGWFLVVLHASLCTGDFLVWWRLLTRVPRGTWLHNNGWTTYWTRQEQIDG